jgi:tetratricopeptide (TPR) repeat protein
MKNVIVLLLVSILLASCAAAPPKYSRSDIAAATSREQQIALYEALEAELAISSKGTNADAYRVLKSDLGKKLGMEESQRIRDELGRSTLSSGAVPLDVISRAETAAEPIRGWDLSAYNDLTAELSQKRAASEGALAEEQALLARSSRLRDPVSHVQTLGRINELHGDNAAASAAYETAFQETSEQLSSSGEQALQGGDFETALRDYESLKRLDPDYPGIDRLIINSQSGIESSGFRRLLANGDIEGAYSAFVNLSGRDLSPAQKQEFVGPVGNLADFFVEDAENKVRGRQYAGAYLAIKREMSIREWIGEPSRISGPTRAGFSSAMFDLAAASSALDRNGLEYGYLLLVQEFDPYYSSLDSRMRETRETVYDNAIRRVGAVTITSPDPAKQQIASQISAGVREYLMENIPEDVKILERDKLEDVKRERGMSDEANERGDRFKELESTDYLIEGDLLTAQVDEEVGNIKQRKRVVTGEAEVTNPDFTAWIKEKGSRKADHPDAPPKTVMQAVEEDIVLNVEERRKYAEVGVAYRVIDTISAEHVHGDTVSRSQEASGKGQEGVQIGTFVQEAKMADVPSNMEMINELIDEVVDVMSRDLVAYLANPDGDYFENCKQLNAEDENVEAAELCANAVVLREYKELDNTDVVTWLKKVTLNSGMRPD